MTLRAKSFVLGTLAALLGTFLYGRCNRTPVRVAVTQPLPVNDKEVIRVDPGSHTITIQTDKGIKKEFLPDRQSTIEIKKNGEVKVEVKQFGFETEGFGGIGYGERTRVICGIDLLYFHRFDLGLGASVTLSPLVLVNTRAMATLSYTIASNTRLTVAYDNHGQVGGFVTLRF